MHNFLGCATMNNDIGSQTSETTDFYCYKMIDISQWRAVIGLWNCCQASSRLARCHSPRKLLKKGTLNRTHSLQTSKPLFLPLLILVLYLILIFAAETITLKGIIIIVHTNV